MGKRLAIVVLLVLVGVLVYLVCPYIRSPVNAEFTIKITGSEGTEFEGFVTHEVKYLIGSRTEVTHLQGKITANQNTFEFNIPETQYSGNITCKTLGKNITVIYAHDGIEGPPLEGTAYYFSG
jgi:hypothetical protein